MPGGALCLNTENAVCTMRQQQVFIYTPALIDTLQDSTLSSVISLWGH